MIEAVEAYVAESALSIVGDPALIGVMIALFFVGGVLVTQLSLDAALTVLIPAFFLVFVWIPELKILAGLIIGFLIFVGFMRVIRR